LNHKSIIMKIYLFVLPLLFYLGGYSQGPIMYYMTFDDTLNLNHLIIDTLSNPSNIWQIGTPSKPGFGSAYTPPHVIATDTINPYPIGNHSSFLIWNIADGGFAFDYIVKLAGWYQVNSDSLHDYGLIEFSPDNGTTWVDLINDTSIQSHIVWETDKPVLTGKSQSWQYFAVNLQDLGIYFNIQEGDTVLYRFTFISDSLFDNLPGLMYDQLWFEDWVESIFDGTVNSSGCLAYPNPASENVILECQNHFGNGINVVIKNFYGQDVFTERFESKMIKIPLQNLSPGIYFYQIIDENGSSVCDGKFVKAN